MGPLVADGLTDRALIGDAAAVLDAFRVRCRRNGVGMPADLEGLLLALLDASERQAAPKLDDDADRAEPLLVTYAAAARRLSVSPRTATRLVTTGALPTVRVAGCRRIAVADLAAYVESLERRRSS